MNGPNAKSAFRVLYGPRSTNSEGQNTHKVLKFFFFISVRFFFSSNLFGLETHRAKSEHGQNCVYREKKTNRMPHEAHVTKKK